jgi:hypothetical protein
MCAPRFASVLVRSIDGQWWVVEGIENAEPNDRNFQNHGRNFDTREEAFTYAVELAGALGFDQTRVLEI